VTKGGVVARAVCWAWRRALEKLQVRAAVGRVVVLDQGRRTRPRQSVIDFHSAIRSRPCEPQAVGCASVCLSSVAVLLEQQIHRVSASFQNDARRGAHTFLERVRNVGSPIFFDSPSTNAARRVEVLHGLRSRLSNISASVAGGRAVAERKAAVLGKGRGRGPDASALQRTEAGSCRCP
jgi:hypothetical protein